MLIRFCFPAQGTVMISAIFKQPYDIVCFFFLWPVLLIFGIVMEIQIKETMLVLSWNQNMIAF